MNLFALLSLIATIITFSLGIIVYFFNRKASLNKLFLIANLALFAYSFTTVLMWASDNAETAYFWHKMGTIWPFFVALVLHFALVFSNNKWITKRQNYFLLYLPAVAFWLIDLFTNVINNPPVLKYWGFNDVPSGTLIYYLSSVWTAVLPIIAFIICFRYYRQTTDTTQRQQRKNVAIGFSIPIAAFIATNIVSRSVAFDIPNLGIFATLFFSIFVGYAIVKYELFTINAKVAAENIIETIPDSFILADPNGQILRVNDRMVDFLGYSAKELTSTKIATLLSNEERCNWDNVVYQLKQHNLLRDFELKFATKTGDIRQALFSGSIVRSRSGKTIGITCIMKDITGRIEMEERLLKSEQLSSIGEIAGQVGHDLRNPLAAIKNGVYLLKKKNSSKQVDERKQICDWIELAIADSDRIINSLVEYASNLYLQKEYCTPKSLTLNALSKIEVPDRISLDNQTSDKLLIFIDAQKIESAFKRIIQNAIDAIPQNGSIKINSRLNGPNVEIAFTDSGIGIPETIQHKIFTPLVTTKAKGMGMSLAICKRLVDAHEGSLTFETIKNHGSTFTFALPTST